MIQPRLLREGDAAQYVGRSKTSFREQVRASILPAPLTRNGNVRLWDRHALDKYVDSLRGESAASAGWEGL